MEHGTMQARAKEPTPTDVVAEAALRTASQLGILMFEAIEFGASYARGMRATRDWRRDG